METQARHSDGSEVSKEDIIMMQGRVMGLWTPNLNRDEWKLSESELSSVWTFIFAKFVRDICEGHPVDFEELEAELLKMQEEVLRHLDVDKHCLGNAIQDDPGWVTVGQLFQARVDHLINDPETHVATAADVAVEFPVVHDPYGGSPLYESNPKLRRVVSQMVPSVCFEREVPFHGGSAI